MGLTGRLAASTWWLLALVMAGYVAGAELSWHSFSAGAAFGFPPAGHHPGGAPADWQVAVAARYCRDRHRRGRR